MEPISVEKVLANWLSKNMKSVGLRNIDLEGILQAGGYGLTVSHINILKKQGMSYDMATKIAGVLGWVLPDITRGTVKTSLDSQARIDRRKMLLATAKWLNNKQLETGLKSHALSKILQLHGLKYTNYDLRNMKSNGMSYEKAFQIARAVDWSLPTEQQLLDSEKY